MTKLKSFIYFQIVVWSLIIMALMSGCAMVTQPAKKLDYYKSHILDWQERIQQEGWHETLIKKIIKNSLYLVKYQAEGKNPDGKCLDHWQMPSELIKNDFQGDCEDIATFLYFVLKKQLQYPYQVRIRAVATIIPDQEHALLRVELPDGKWKTYETTPFMGFEWLDRATYRTLFEWDEEKIYTGKEIS